MIDGPYWFHKLMAACQGAARGVAADWAVPAVFVTEVVPGADGAEVGIFLDKSIMMDHALEIWTWRNEKALL